MSFYGSQPTLNSSAPQHHRSNPPNAPTWPPASLDQLLFQDSDLPVTQLGGLRRSTPQPPLAIDPNFPLVDSVSPEFPTFPTDPDSNERLMLESARFDLDALQKRPTPNPPQLNHLQKTAKLAPQQPLIYDYSIDQAPVPISGCNVSLLPEAFDIPADLCLDPSPDIAIFREKHARKVGVGLYTEQLMNFNREQQQGTKEHSLDNFWKPLIASYFAPDASLHIDLKSTSNSKPRSIRVPVEALPRIWKSKLDAGVSEERTLLENPCEFHLPNGIVVVDCPKTVILTTYQNSVVQTDGYLRVRFHRDKKIAMWQFSSQKHEELYTKKGLTAGVIPAIPPSACSEFGIPAAVVRLMMIANDVNDLADSIEAEISKLARNPERIAAWQNAAHSSDGRRVGAGTQAAFHAPPPPSGHAYRALSSMLDGPQSDQSVRAPNLGIPVARPSNSASAGGLSEEIDAEVRKVMENDNSLVPNLREAMSSWKAESQPPVMFPNLFDLGPIRAPMVPAGTGDAQKNSSQHQVDLKMQGRYPRNRGDGRRKARSHSAMEAVAAAASGQGGWGIGASGQRELGGGEAVGNGLDPSLQLLTTATDANLTLRNAGESSLRDSVSRQDRPPPGLSLFNPPSRELERSETIVQRERNSREASMAGLGSIGLRTGTVGQGMKEVENLRTFQRLSPKAKREHVAEAGREVLAGSTHGEYAGMRKGMMEQNGGIVHGKSGARNDVGKSGKDKTNSTSGGRRSAHRSPLGDERREKRQKGIGDQK